MTHTNHHSRHLFAWWLQWSLRRLRLRLRSWWHRCHRHHSDRPRRSASHGTDLIRQARYRMSRLAMLPENHLIGRVGWLRAAVLGANDGILSTASLIVGVAAAAAAQHDVLIAGVAGLVAGAMSMAAGEYVSVSSQSATEKADIAKERRELRSNPEAELE